MASCAICTTMVRVAVSVAAALGCQLVVLKIRRCSTSGPVMADALSLAGFLPGQSGGGGLRGISGCGPGGSAGGAAAVAREAGPG